MTLSLQERFRNLKRLQSIVSVLLRHGFGDVVARLKLDVVTVRRRRARAAAAEGQAWQRQTVEERIRHTLEDLGPTFVKLGQVMATRPDLVPPSLVLELRQLQDQVPPFPVDQLKAAIEEDAGRPLADLFVSFDETPLAAASVAQVHRARLHDGSEVAVKVQRPRVRETVASDLSILRGLAELVVERIPEARRFDPVGLVNEFDRALRRELDFRNEVYAMQRFARHHAGSPDAVVPRPHTALCSERVIVMELMAGFKVTDHAALAATGLDPVEIARRGTRIALTSIFEHGYFHADPHPGNFLIRPDGVFCVLDFGLMGQLDAQRIDEMLTFLAAILLSDADMLVTLLEDMELVPDTVDERSLRRELSMQIERYQGLALEDLDAAALVAEIIDAMRRYDIHLPADLVLVGKALGTMEGIAKTICPSFRPLDEVRPYLISTYVRRTLDPREHSRQVARTLSESLNLLRSLPRDLRGILRKANRGELQVRISSADLERVARQRDRAVNRSIATVVFSLLVALSTVLLYYPPPGSGPGVVALALGGYFVAFLTGLVLLWSIYRSNGL